MPNNWPNTDVYAVIHLNYSRVSEIVSNHTSYLLSRGGSEIVVSRRVQHTLTEKSNTLCIESMRMDFYYNLMSS